MRDMKDERGTPERLSEIGTHLRNIKFFKSYKHKINTKIISFKINIIMLISLISLIGSIFEVYHNFIDRNIHEMILDGVIAILSLTLVVRVALKYKRDYAYASTMIGIEIALIWGSLLIFEVLISL